LSILFRHFGFLALKFSLSCLDALILAILIKPFGFLAPANSGSKKPKGLKQDRQNLGARTPKGLNRIDKIWEKENQRA
jgi:hypothetical protein